MPTPLGGKFHDTYLELPRRLPLKDFAQECRTVGKMVRSNPWWAADLVEHGEAIYGETAWQYLDELGYEERTLTTIARVGRQVPKERRRAALSFEHHRLVAALEPEQQTEWLRRAEKKKLTRAKFREALLQVGLIKGRARAKAKLDTEDLWLRVRKALDLLKAARDRMEGKPWPDEEVKTLITALTETLSATGVGRVNEPAN